jgi:hypothetical protein
MQVNHAGGPGASLETRVLRPSASFRPDSARPSVNQSRPSSTCSVARIAAVLLARFVRHGMSVHHEPTEAEAMIARAMRH